jgi:hypothetical protein
VIKRDAFLYLDPKGKGEDFAQCRSCMMWTGTAGAHPLRCHIHGKGRKITGDHTCGYYVHGKPMPNGPIMRSVTPKESGLLKKEVRCENCKHFNSSASECGYFVKLNKTGGHALNVIVNYEGCCNAWEEDKMPADEIMGKYKKGTLQSSSGHKVTNPAQARAIAHSYAKKSKPKRRKKKGGISGMLQTRYGAEGGNSNPVNY